MLYKSQILFQNVWYIFVQDFRVFFAHVFGVCFRLSMVLSLLLSPALRLSVCLSRSRYVWCCVMGSLSLFSSHTCKELFSVTVGISIVAISGLISLDSIVFLLFVLSSNILQFFLIDFQTLKCIEQNWPIIDSGGHFRIYWMVNMLCHCPGFVHVGLLQLDTICGTLSNLCKKSMFTHLTCINMQFLSLIFQCTKCPVKSVPDHRVA